MCWAAVLNADVVALSYAACHLSVLQHSPQAPRYMRMCADAAPCCYQECLVSSYAPPAGSQVYVRNNQGAVTLFDTTTVSGGSRCDHPPSTQSTPQPLQYQAPGAQTSLPPVLSSQPPLALQLPPPLPMASQSSSSPPPPWVWPSWPNGKDTRQIMPLLAHVRVKWWLCLCISCSCSHSSLLAVCCFSFF